MFLSDQSNLSESISSHLSRSIKSVWINLIPSKQINQRNLISSQQINQISLIPSHQIIKIRLNHSDPISNQISLNPSDPISVDQSNQFESIWSHLGRFQLNQSESIYSHLSRSISSVWINLIPSQQINQITLIYCNPLSEFQPNPSESIWSHAHIRISVKSV